MACVNCFRCTRVRLWRRNTVCAYRRSGPTRPGARPRVPARSANDVSKDPDVTQRHSRAGASGRARRPRVRPALYRDAGYHRHKRSNLTIDLQRIRSGFVMTRIGDVK
ncbi:hypothetical protein EVAR_29325_1 [Eumeta japonica]|uniref:Uncharacterized protein n=1 Tax=Eumeta variegata TaxID=151549 RepID=A0A4C1WGK9_EUMVA|nr:hypothetical protein EVAR_29325_1 [Eumeta japonica]